MDCLWSAHEPQTVQQVHAALSARGLAYTTIMTVSRRLADKGLVMQYRDARAYRYAPAFGRDELVASLMVDALDNATDSPGRQAALVHFVARVGTDDAGALRRALVQLETKRPMPVAVTTSAQAQASQPRVTRVPEPSMHCPETSESHLVVTGQDNAHRTAGVCHPG